MSKVVFSDLGLSDCLLEVISEKGYKYPTEIQEKAIPLLLESDKNFVGQAQTGTGKTAAFILPLLSKVDSEASHTQAIILAPTRELAMQIEKEIVVFSKNTNIRSTCIYGGVDYQGQASILKNEQPQIVVGTPGRVLDMAKRGFLKLNKANVCVLDEADEMLTMGFVEDVELILSRLNKSTQLMMFSATMPKSILSLIKDSFKEHNLVKIEKKSLSNDDIDQRYFIVRDKHFKEALSRLIDDAGDMYGIVFCRTKIETKEVGDDLKKRGLNVDVLNGDMGQPERDLAMRKFKTKKVNILVCTDVAARGIDVTNLTHVFNFGLPRDNESYVHRIGRTGRAGMKGAAYSIIGPRMVREIKTLEDHVKQKIVFSKLPTVEKLKRNVVLKEIDNARYMVDAIKSKGDDFKCEESLALVKEQFGDLTNDQLMKLMFTWKFNKTMRHLNNIAEIEGERDDSSYKKPNGKSRFAAKNRISRQKKNK